MLDTMRVLPQNMRKAAAGGFINATDCADWLTKNGVPFRDAYKATGELVARCIELGTDLESLPLDEYKKVCDVFTEEVYDAISLEKCVSQRTAFGGPAPELVKAQAKRVAAIAEVAQNLPHERADPADTTMLGKRAHHVHLSGIYGRAAKGDAVPQRGDAGDHGPFVIKEPP
jgi:hypothetical protein